MLSIVKRILNSIALVPSVLALCFVFIAIFLLLVDFAVDESSILGGFVITEKSDVQFILSFIIGGIFTLTIFSYTMVMNVLNRNINNYSPRLIPMLLAEKHHQVILGFSSGTILYAMILSIAVAGSKGDEFPPLGASLGVIFAMGCVFLFIYFIHSVSQSIHINHIIKEVFDRTEKNIQKQDTSHQKFSIQKSFDTLENSYAAEKAGYLHQPDFNDLLKFCEKEKIHVNIHKFPGMFLLRGETILTYNGNLNSNKLESFKKSFAIDENVPLDIPEIGFKHLVEVAVKAMSPAINDPGTAKAALDYLTQLFLYRAKFDYFDNEFIQVSKYVNRAIITQTVLLENCFVEMEHYMKDDPLISIVLQNSKYIIQNNKS